MTVALERVHVPPTTLRPGTPWFPDNAHVDVLDALSAMEFRLVVVDTETTGLDPFTGAQVTEVAWYCLNSGLGGMFIPAHTLDGANDYALEVSRYHERIAGQPQDDGTMVRALYQFLGGDGVRTHIVGSNPGFDCLHLNALFAKYGLPADPWHHRKIDPCAAVYWQSDLPVGAATGLAEAARILGVPLVGHHSAWVDVAATAGVWHALEGARMALTA